MDGSACAILFLNAGGKKENIRFVGAGVLESFIKKNELMATNDFLIFADVGITDPKYYSLLQGRGNFVFIDHHATSLVLEEVEDRSQLYIDMGGCGAELLRKYLAAVVNPKFDRHSFRSFTAVVDDQDRWLNRYPASQELIMFVSMAGQEDFIERFLDVTERFSLPSFVEMQQGDESVDLQPLKTTGFFKEFETEFLKVMIRRRDENIETALKKVVVKEQDFPGVGKVKVGYLVSGDPNISLILHLMLDRHPEIQMAVQISLDRNSASLRSRGDFDTTKVSTLFGGGGHKAASGHKLDKDLAKMIIDEVHG